MAENLSNLIKHMNVNVQEAQQISSKMTHT